MIEWKKIIPEVKLELSKNTTNQFYRVLDELVEAEVELVNGNRQLFLREMIDTIHASFNTIYKECYTNQEINEAIQYVVTNNHARGKYY